MTRLAAEPLVFLATNATSLTPAPPGALSSRSWEGLALALGQEPTLSQYPAHALTSRWQQGRAAVAVDGDEIVAYVSLIPLFDDNVAHRLGAQLHLDARPLEGSGVFESATGWTHPAWRGHGLSRALRQVVLAQAAQADRVFLGATIGMGASPVLASLGWWLCGWDALPFVSAVIGMPATDATARRAIPFRQHAGRPHLGAPVAADALHAVPAWDGFAWLWFADLAVATDLDRRLSAWCGGDLERWRDAVVEVRYTHPPEPAWKPFLFSVG